MRAPSGVVVGALEEILAPVGGRAIKVGACDVAEVEDARVRERMCALVWKWFVVEGSSIRSEVWRWA